jgi:hypothetical protein
MRSSENSELTAIRRISFSRCKTAISRIMTVLMRTPRRSHFRKVFIEVLSVVCASLTCVMRGGKSGYPIHPAAMKTDAAKGQRDIAARGAGPKPQGQRRAVVATFGVIIGGVAPVQSGASVTVAFDWPSRAPLMSSAKRFQSRFKPALAPNSDTRMELGKWLTITWPAAIKAAVRRTSLVWGGAVNEGVDEVCVARQHLRHCQPQCVIGRDVRRVDGRQCRVSFQVKCVQALHRRNGTLSPRGPISPCQSNKRSVRGVPRAKRAAKTQQSWAMNSDPSVVQARA